MGMDVFGKAPDSYFRASCWSWRPIHALCDSIIEKQNLPLSTKGWDFNDGEGLKTPEECNQLADAIEAHLKQSPLKEDDDKIYLCLSCWCTSSGSLLPTEIEEVLNQKYPIGTVLPGPIVMVDGTLAYPAHSTSLDHIKEFITFLRTCEGFEIW